MVVVRMNPKKCNLSRDFTRDRLEWRKRIHVAELNIVMTDDKVLTMNDDDDDAKVLTTENNVKYLL